MASDCCSRHCIREETGPHCTSWELPQESHPMPTTVSLRSLWFIFQCVSDLLDGVEAQALMGPHYDSQHYSRFLLLQVDPEMVRRMFIWLAEKHLRNLSNVPVVLVVLPMNACGCVILYNEVRKLPKTHFKLHIMVSCFSPDYQSQHLPKALQHQIALACRQPIKDRFCGTGTPITPPRLAQKAMKSNRGAIFTSSSACEWGANDSVESYSVLSSVLTHLLYHGVVRL